MKKNNRRKIIKKGKKKPLERKQLKKMRNKGTLRNNFLKNQKEVLLKLLA